MDWAKDSERGGGFCGGKPIKTFMCHDAVYLAAQNIQAGDFYRIELIFIFGTDGERDAIMGSPLKALWKNVRSDMLSLTLKTTKNKNMGTAKATTVIRLMRKDQKILLFMISRPVCFKVL